MPALSPSACLQRLAEHDADVFDRVMLIDVQVADRFDRQVDRRVPRQQRQHVIEEPDAGRQLGNARAIEIDFQLDVGLVRLALNCAPCGPSITLSRQTSLASYALRAGERAPHFIIVPSSVRQASICSSVPTEIRSPSPQPA